MILRTNTGSMMFGEYRDCVWCGGDGHVDFHICNTCAGFGWGWLEKDGSFTPDQDHDPKITFEQCEERRRERFEEDQAETRREIQAFRSEN
jgi:hypothetical protein